MLRTFLTVRAHPTDYETARMYKTKGRIYILFLRKQFYIPSNIIVGKEARNKEMNTE